MGLACPPSTPRRARSPAAVLVVVAVLLTLYVLYLLRKPLSWLIIAAFIAVAAAGPVNVLQRHMKRGLAIAIVYLVADPDPDRARGAPDPAARRRGRRSVADNAPEYVQDVDDYVAGEQDPQQPERGLRHHHQAPGRGREAAGEDPGRRQRPRATSGSGWSTRSSPAVTIFILSIFMVAGGPRWVERLRGDAAPRARRAHRADPAADRQRRRQLRRRGADPGDDRRRQSRSSC